MDGKIEQYVCIKFCVKLGKSATETSEMLHEVFGEHSLSRTVVSEWHARFKAGRVSVEDDKCSGRPSTSKTTEMLKKFEIFHRQFVPPNTTVNSGFYCDVLRRLRENV
jgi:hypothetical protein